MSIWNFAKYYWYSRKVIFWMCIVVVSFLLDGENTVDLQSIALIERFCKFWVFGFYIG